MATEIMTAPKPDFLSLLSLNIMKCYYYLVLSIAIEYRSSGSSVYGPFEGIATNSE